MNKYKVRIENRVVNIDLGEVIVEASSIDEAKKIAIDKVNSGKANVDWWSSDCLDSEIDMEHYDDWLVDDMS